MKHTLISIFALLVFGQCNLEKIDDQLVPAGPNAQFGVDKTTCDAPCTISITNNTTNATTFSWNFGDNSTSTEENPPAHLYANAGNYTIRLIATGGSLKDTFSVQVSIVNAGVKPTPNFTIVNNGCTAPCTLTFNNTTTNGATYRWDFGDPTSTTNTSTDISTTHKYNMPGSYAVKLVATNGSLKDSITQIVTVNGVKFQSTASSNGPMARMRQLADGGYIGVGSTNNTVYLVRLDASGNVIGQQTYPFSNGDLAYDVIQLSDGSFVAVGSSFNAGTGENDCFYLRTNSSLTAINGPVRVGEPVRSEVAHSVVELTDGSLLICGSSNDPATNSSDVYALRYNPSLTTEYFKKIIAGPEYEYAIDAVEVNDGFMFCGYTSYTNGAPSDAFVLKLDNNGNKVTGFPKNFGIANSDAALALEKTSSTEIAVAGYLDSDAFYQKIDNNGNMVGSAVVSNKAGNDFSFDLAVDAEGNIALTGMAALDAFFLKFSPTGIILVDKTYPTNGDDAFNSIQATTDGGYIMAGYKSGGWYYIKTDKDGNFN